MYISSYSSDSKGVSDLMNLYSSSSVGNEWCIADHRRAEKAREKCALRREEFEKSANQEMKYVLFVV